MSSAGGSRGREAAVGRGPAVDPVDAEGAPVVALDVPCDEVPDAVDVDQPARLDQPSRAARRRRCGSGNRSRSLSRAAAAIADSSSWSTAGPRRASARGEAVERADAPTQVVGQHLLQLRQRPQGRLLDPGDGAARGPQADRDRDRLLVVEQQRRQLGTGAEPVAAGDAAGRVDRVAELAQLVDVAADRARRHGGAGRPARRAPTRAASAAATAVSSRRPEVSIIVLRSVAED